MYRFGVLLAAVFGALIVAGSAFAHSAMSPAVGLTKADQLFTLSVLTEKGVPTTKVELTPPSGFSIESFSPSPGWKREVQSTGSGEETEIQRVTWSGGNVPTGEDAVFQFIGSADKAETYAFNVRQTYSDGSVVDWDGPESSDTPAARVEMKPSLGGGGSDTLAIVALVAAALAALLAVASLLTGSGRRSLT